jgi:hypothetical protein
MLLQGPCPTSFHIADKGERAGETAVNTGVIYIRGDPATSAFLEQVQQQHIQAHASGYLMVDQAIFEQLLPNATIEWHVLDTAVFPVACMSSGPLANWHLGVLWPYSTDISPVLVHMNLSPAPKKVAKLKRLGLWLLSDNEEERADSENVTPTTCLEDWQPPVHPVARSGGSVRGHFAEALSTVIRKTGSTVPGSLAHHMVESEDSCMPNFADFMLKANLRAWKEAGLVVG